MIDNKLTKGRSDVFINQETRCLELVGRFVTRSVRYSSRNTVVLNPWDNTVMTLTDVMDTESVWRTQYVSSVVEVCYGQ